jgi:hypothetical protein
MKLSLLEKYFYQYFGLRKLMPDMNKKMTQLLQPILAE